MKAEQSIPNLDLRIGVVVKRLRHRKGMTQKSLAEKACVSQACISLLENEHRNRKGLRANLNTLSRIAHILGNHSLSDLIRFAEGSFDFNEISSELVDFIEGKIL